MKKINYNKGWFFWSAEDAGNITEVSLPHDAMLREKRLKNLNAGAATGYFPGGRYFYKKIIHPSEELIDKTVILEFQGVYMNSTVYLNDKPVGGRLYGYSRFFVNLTDSLLEGQDNELLVEVDNTQTPNSRWYSGSGIYRDVFLWIGARECLKPDCLFVMNSKECPGKLNITVDKELEPSEELHITVSNEQNYIKEVVGSQAELYVENPRLWSESEQNFYQVEAILYKNNQIIDSHIERIGVRSLSWDADRGMRINGNQIKLRGGCIHHDNGLLGACSYYDAEFRRASKLKHMGYNAIRYSHNPAGEAFLQACDDVGIYVIVEAFDAWRGKMLDYDYGVDFDEEWEKDLRDMILVARNHPCVIAYCIGNEISDTGSQEGAVLNKKMSDYCRSLDPSRPVMHAFNPVVSKLGATNKTETKRSDVVDPKRQDENSSTNGSLLANTIATIAPFMQKVMGKPDKVEKLLKPCFDEVDIVGYNYAEGCYEKHHEWNPNRIMVGSETYPGAITKNWPLIEKMPYVIGDFMWTAWDYLGEAGIGVPIYGKKHGGFNRPYPCISGGNGAFNLIGEAETPAYIAAITWGLYDSPYIAIRPVNHSDEKYFFGQWRSTDAVSSWSFTGMEGRNAYIEVYSKGYEVELFQNGKSLGRKRLKDFKVEFKTKYQKGTLSAISYDNLGKKIGESTLTSAGDELKLMLTKEQIQPLEANDLIFINAELTDENGIRKLLCDKKIDVKVEGDGELLAIGSSNPITEEAYLGSSFTSYQGVLQIIVKKTGNGEICVSASSSDGLLNTLVISEE